MQAAGIPGQGYDSRLVQKVDIFMAARDLLKMDMLSNSDPFCVVSIKAATSNQYIEVGRSEVIMDTQNPDWTHQFVLDYFFEEIQQVKVEVYDEDKKGVTDLTKHDFCGGVEFRLGTLMGTTAQSLRLPLTRNNSSTGNGFITLKAEPVAECNDFFRVQFQAVRKLAKKDGFFAKSDPFIAAHRLREDNSWVRVWKSEIIIQNLMPTWKLAQIPVQQLCNGDYNRPIRFEIHDWDDDGSTDYMGSFQTSLQELVASPQAERLVIEEEKKKKSSYRDSGAISCRIAEVIREPSFLDYVRGNCQLNFIVAIDFTGSNGNPSSPSSLHYIDPSGRAMNEYQQAIISVGQIIQEYDTDKNFPVYGFGARVGGKVTHAFSVYPEGVEVHGVEGIMNAYRECLPRVELSGPTLFAPIIQTALGRCNTTNSQANQHYTVLLIICDGIVNDMPQTIDAVIESSRFPLSIIIVGVGNADFSDMTILDADDGLLSSVSGSGKRAVRDIVQFVPMRNYRTQHVSRLAAEVLKEVPGQLVQYMKACNFYPNPPLQQQGGGGGGVVQQQGQGSQGQGSNDLPGYSA